MSKKIETQHTKTHGMHQKQWRVTAIYDYKKEKSQICNITYPKTQEKWKPKGGGSK